MGRTIRVLRQCVGLPRCRSSQAVRLCTGNAVRSWGPPWLRRLPWLWPYKRIDVLRPSHHWSDSTIGSSPWRIVGRRSAHSDCSVMFWETQYGGRSEESRTKDDHALVTGRATCYDVVQVFTRMYDKDGGKSRSGRRRSLRPRRSRRLFSSLRLPFAARSVRLEGQQELSGWS